MKPLVIAVAFVAFMATAVGGEAERGRTAGDAQTVEALAAPGGSGSGNPTSVAVAIASASTAASGQSGAGASTAAAAVASAISASPDGSAPSGPAAGTGSSKSAEQAASPTGPSSKTGPGGTTATTRPKAPSTPTPTTAKPPPPAPPPPPGPQHHVFSADTTFTSTFTLRPGDTVTLRNGACLCFGGGGRADWRGTPAFTWSDDGTKQNLGRDIKITGSGHIRFMAGSVASTIAYVEIDLRPPVEVGKYPLHWHHAGSGSQGTLVEGVVIKNSPNRAFVPHASHGITFRHTIAKDVAGSGYWWDPPSYQSSSQAENSNDIVYDHALVDGVVPLAGDAGHRLMGFMLGAGRRNSVVNSVAMNVNGGKDSAGFQWPESHGSQPNLWRFENNAAHHNKRNGIFVWQNNGQSQVVKNYRGYDNGSADIDHGAYTNVYTYRDVRASRIEIHAVGWTVKGGVVDLAIAKRHRLAGDPITFTSVIVGRFVVDNASGSGIRNPGHYVFDNTGLTWDNVRIASVVPGTTITIDGEKRRY